ncbi:MAG: peptide chain release factor 2 [Elusimicrobia bacterium]|nr:peptide chain release factor 2 [Elusimicrobiota bacterium]
MLPELKEKTKKLLQKTDELGGIFDIENKIREITEIEKTAAAANFWNNPAEAQKTMQHLNSLKSQITKYQSITKELAETSELLFILETENDESMHPDIERVLEKIEGELSEMDLQSKLSGEFDKNGAIVSIHSGAGGTEACDWADMLLRLYLRWAERKNFKTEIVDSLAGDEAGIKSITFIVKGEYAYGYLKAEIGVHRLVRISPFDANKRRHTSFASVDVIPEIEDDIEIKIDENDLRIDTYRAGGHGGQYLQKTDSAVRITHNPTGIVVQSQNERSQFKNKATSMKLLKAKLYELEQEKKRAQVEKHYDEKGSIAWGSQIRSYVFMPYQLVKDHRTGFETGNVQKVMDGDIDKFIQAYLSQKTKKKP